MIVVPKDNIAFRCDNFPALRNPVWECWSPACRVLQASDKASDTSFLTPARLPESELAVVARYLKPLGCAGLVSAVGGASMRHP